MVCVTCGTKLKEIPFYTGKKKEFAPSIPFCPNDTCVRAGLLTVNFKSKESDEKNRNEGVSKEDVLSSKGTSVHSL